MEFTKEQFTQFRADLKEAVKELEKIYKVEIEPRNITYESDSFTLKVVVTKNEDGGNVEQKRFEKECSLFGFKPEDYLIQFTDGHSTFELYGFKPNSRKNSCMIRDINTKHNYVCNPDFIKSKLGRQATIKLTGNTHRCKYCGKVVQGTNEDLLCDECQETFGHRYYSEL